MENKLDVYSPQRLDSMIRVAEKFYKAGCFGSDVQNAEQAFVKMQAGDEMGMKPMEAMNDLYIVKGRVGLHSKGLSAAFKRHGYEIVWGQCDATKASVTVKKDGKEYSESASKDEMKNSRAYSIAPENKLRYHCLRKLINFQTPDVGGSVMNLDEDEAVDLPPATVDVVESGSDLTSLKEKIDKVETIDGLQEVLTEIGSVGKAFTDEEVKELRKVAKEKKDELQQSKPRPVEDSAPVVDPLQTSITPEEDAAYQD